MILTKIDSEQIIGYYLDEDNRVLNYSLNFDGNNQEYNCLLSHLPDELQTEFKDWVKKVNNYINENITIKK